MESLPLTTLLLVGTVIVLSMALRYMANAVGQGIISKGVGV